MNDPGEPAAGAADTASPGAPPALAASSASAASVTSIAPPAPVVPGSVGILGGTFDPIHTGHLAIAEEAREALGLERVLVVPAADPPHKPDHAVSEARHRLAMVELAVAGNPALAVSRIELERDGPSYSVDTLAALRASGVTDLWFIMSAETLAELPTWHRPEAILDLCRLAVLPRAGSSVLDRGWVGARFPGREDRVVFLPGPLLPISGSVVRRRAAVGRSIRYLVPDPVERYIIDHHLYRQPASEAHAT